MARYVALLRGVNVGKGNRVAMADLRALLAGLGFDAVATLLNSGNAVFSAGGRTSSRTHARTISEALASKLRVEVPVIVKSSSEFGSIVQGNPFASAIADPARMLVAFTQDASTLAGLQELNALVVPPEQFATGRHAAYLHCVNGILESKVGAALLGRQGRQATTRNWTTTLKLRAMLDDDVE